MGGTTIRTKSKRKNNHNFIADQTTAADVNAERQSARTESILVLLYGTLMSTPAAATTTPTKQKAKTTRKASEKEKDKEGDLSKEEKADRLKTVVRRLPPNLPEEVFWQSVQTWVTDESITWKVYHPGKVGKRCAT